MAVPFSLTLGVPKLLLIPMPHRLNGPSKKSFSVDDVVGDDRVSSRKLLKQGTVLIPITLSAALTSMPPSQNSGDTILRLLGQFPVTVAELVMEQYGWLLAQMFTVGAARSSRLASAHWPGVGLVTPAAQPPLNAFGNPGWFHEYTAGTETPP